MSSTETTPPPEPKRSLHLLLPLGVIEDPEHKRELAGKVVAGYCALWHPSLLAGSDHIPTWRDINDLPSEKDCIVAVPDQVLASASELIRRDVAELGCPVLEVRAEHVAAEGPLRLAEALEEARRDDPLVRDFFALGYSFLGLEILLQQMSRDHTLDEWAFAEEARRAATAWAREDEEEARAGLQAAFDLLLAARHHVYPANIGLIDLAIFHPDLTADSLAERGRQRAAWNLILSGREGDALLRDQPETMEALRRLVGENQLEILSGPYSARPFPILPIESRTWEVGRSIDLLEEQLGRSIESYASRTMALTADLPQLLMKFGFRHAVHAAFGPGKIPYFRDPKLHWTSRDGSVVESLARVARSASAPEDGLTFFASLAQSLSKDRAATVVLAHWAHQSAPWHELLLRSNEYVELFGRFCTLTDYFVHAYTADKPTETFVEEYQTGALESSVAAGEARPLSRWIDHLQQRGRLESAESLGALAYLAGGEPPEDSSPLEDALETGDPGVDERLGRAYEAAADRLAAALLKGTPPAEGFLFLNPSSFPRRVSAIVPDGPTGLAAEAPLRSLSPLPAGSAVVVDVPGWGYAWLPAKGEEPAHRTAAIASGKRLRNDLIEVEFDGKTGGLRGIWQVRTGYSRLGQQLVSSIPGSRPRAASVEVAVAGPTFGEIVASGDIVGPDGSDVLARFQQRARLWLGKPVLELSIELDVLRRPSGNPWENYFGCRWAWPDEKTIVAPASGLLLESHRGAVWEAPLRIELRERHLATNVYPRGLAFHKRIGHRMCDTLLAVEGEGRSRFEVSIALDLANGWTAAYEGDWPIAIRRVSQGPPASGRTGWLAHLGARNLLCTRLRARKGDEGLMLRIAETGGESTHAELRLARRASSARLANARGQLIFDLYPAETGLPIDFAPWEWNQIEVVF